MSKTVNLDLDALVVEMPQVVIEVDVSDALRDLVILSRPTYEALIQRLRQLERVREAAFSYVAMRKATIETEADSGPLSDRLYEIEGAQLEELDASLTAVEKP